jgi:hypothetical protein
MEISSASRQLQSQRAAQNVGTETRSHCHQRETVKVLAECGRVNGQLQVERETLRGRLSLKQWNPCRRLLLKAGWWNGT